MGIPFVSIPTKSTGVPSNSLKGCIGGANSNTPTEEPAFRRFNDLPPEIRTKIWKSALPEPRIVHLKQKRLYTGTFGLDRIRSDVPVLPVGLFYNIPDAYGFGGYFYNSPHQSERQSTAARYEINDRGDHQNAGRRAVLDLADAVEEGMWGRYRVMEQEDQEQDLDQQRYGNRGIADHEIRLGDEPPGTSLEESDSAMHNSNNQPGLLWGWKSDSPAPALLYVCKESYFLASKLYVRAFGSNSAFPETWFDFDRDFLYLNADSFKQLGDEDPVQAYYRGLEDGFSPEDALRVKNIALLLDGPEEDPRENASRNDYGAYEVFLWGILEFFRNIKHFTVVTEQYCGKHYERGVNPRDDASLAFMEPIAIDKACAKYIAKDPDSPKPMELHEYLIYVDLKKMETYRQEWAISRYNNGNVTYEKAPLFDMPTIDEQIISTVATKTKVEGLQREYEKSLGRERRWPPCHILYKDQDAWVFDYPPADSVSPSKRCRWQVRYGGPDQYSG